MLLGVSVEETWNSLCGSFLNLHMFNPEQLAMLLPNNFSNLLKCSKGSLTPNLWSKDMSSTCESLNRKLWCNRNTWRKMAVDCWLQGGVGFYKAAPCRSPSGETGPIMRLLGPRGIWSSSSEAWTQLICLVLMLFWVAILQWSFRMASGVFSVFSFCWVFDWWFKHFVGEAAGSFTAIQLAAPDWFSEFQPPSR